MSIPYDLYIRRNLQTVIIISDDETDERDGTCTSTLVANTVYSLSDFDYSDEIEEVKRELSSPTLSPSPIKTRRTRSQAHEAPLPAWHGPEAFGFGAPSSPRPWDDVDDEY